MVKLSDTETLITHKFELEGEVLRITAHDKSVRTLSYAQITDVAYTTSIEDITQGKSPIARAVAGGLLLGPLGALVGAISGAGNTVKKSPRFHLIIAYRPRDSEGDAFLTFTDYSLFNSGAKFAQQLKSRALGNVAGTVTTL